MSLKINKRNVVVEDVVSSRLQSGQIPSANELIELYLDPDLIERSVTPAKAPESVINGNIISSSAVNKMLDEIEIDQMAMRITLDESWDRLRNVVTKMMKSLPTVQREAELVTAVATRALSLVPEADGVSVSSEALSVSKGIGLGSVSGADMLLSSGIEIDQNAGVLTLARTSIGAIGATTEADGWSIDGEYRVKVERVIGDPTWTLANDIAKTWTVVATTPSPYGVVTLSNIYSIPDGSLPIKRVEVTIPDASNTQVDVFVDFDGLGNFQLWETAVGRGKIIVDGPSVEAARIRIDLSRFRATDSYFVGTSKYHEYSFQVSEVSVVSSAYVKTGDVVTDPIDMSYGQVMSINVDVEAAIPSTSSISTFVAKQVEGATSIDDFMWIPIDDKSKLSGIVNASIDTQTILAKDPQKVRTGAGVYSNDIYSIGPLSGAITSVVEGHGQLSCVAVTVQSDEDGVLPGLLSVGYDSDPDRKSLIVNASGSTLTGGNYYRLKTCIFSPAQNSKPLALSIDSSITKAIYLNGSDITNRIEEGQISVPLSPGRNELLIYLTTGETASDIPFSISDINGCTIAISKPRIVTESKLNNQEPRVALSGGSVLVNHDPTNMNYVVSYRRADGISVDAVRIRVQLGRGMNGETPQVKRAFVTTGM